VIPGYGGGLHAAKAALESDNRVFGVRSMAQVRYPSQHISAGPYAFARGEHAGGDYRGNGRVLPAELPMTEFHRPSGDCEHRALSTESARAWNQRDHRLRRQGVPLDGDGGAAWYAEGETG